MVIGVGWGGGRVFSRVQIICAGHAGVVIVGGQVFVVVVGLVYGGVVLVVSAAWPQVRLCDEAVVWVEDSRAHGCVPMDYVNWSCHGVRRGWLRSVVLWFPAHVFGHGTEFSSAE
eukprot:11995779-Heterocapsa_arctica.AAC.1